MTTHDPLRLRSVAALPGQRLRLTFGDGWRTEIDLSGWIASTRALRPLRDAALFAKAHVAQHGTTVIWNDAIDLGADNLRNLAVESAGGIGHERIVEWMHRNALTQQQAADAIGISRRMLNYYLSATKPIPLTVALACEGWEARQARKAA